MGPVVEASAKRIKSVRLPFPVRGECVSASQGPAAARLAVVGSVPACHELSRLRRKYMEMLS